MKTPEEIASGIGVEWARQPVGLECLIAAAIRAERDNWDALIERSKLRQSNRIAELERALAVLGEEWQIRFLKERERVEELEKALEPFAAVADWFEVTGVTDETFVEGYSAIRKKKVLLTLDHCRFAAQVLKK